MSLNNTELEPIDGSEEATMTHQEDGGIELTDDDVDKGQMIYREIDDLDDNSNGMDEGSDPL